MRLSYIHIYIYIRIGQSDVPKISKTFYLLGRPKFGQEVLYNSFLNSGHPYK